MTNGLWRRPHDQEIIYEAQQYLTIEKDDGFKRIVNIEDLMKRHGPNKVILFLKEYLKDKEKGLRNLILMDKSQKRIDEYIAAMFRMYMAIKTLEAGKSRRACRPTTTTSVRASTPCSTARRSSSGGSGSP